MLHLAASHDAVIPVSPHEAAGNDPRPITDEAAIQLLHLLRARAIDTQLAPRVEPFHFCALIEATPDRAAEAYLDGLLHVLPQALGRPLLIRRPGPARASFDEAWIIGLIEAAARDDTASLRFAIASRVARAYRRPIGFLVKGLACRLDAEGC